MKEQNTKTPEHVTAFQLAILCLSVVVLIALIVDTITPVNPEVSTIIQTLDNIVCGLFFLDFLIRFRQAESKAAFMKWGWIDLLASIPNIDLLRFGRMARILRIVRLLRGLRAGHRVITIILQNKPKSAFASVLLTTILLVTFCSIAILVAEQGPEANIRSANDAIWWSVTTMTTVGYGDKYPVTTEGRIIAMTLMVGGVGLFGSLSGLVASFFLGTREETPSDLKLLMARVEELHQKLDSFKTNSPN